MALDITLVTSLNSPQLLHVTSFCVQTDINVPLYTHYEIVNIISAPYLIIRLLRIYLYIAGDLGCFLFECIEVLLCLTNLSERWLVKSG